jgi:hypothetical protein
MPNWTQNTIRITGRPEEINAFLQAVTSGSQVFDFNRIIPMPPILRHTVSGSRSFDGVTHRAWYVENPDAGWKEHIERPFTEAERKTLADLDYFSWYEWSLAKWGTKWNACDSEITEPSTIDEGYVEIRFDTPWSMPEPIANKVFEMFPDLAITWTWSNEDDGYTMQYSMTRDPIHDDEEVAA